MKRLYMIIAFTFVMMRIVNAQLLCVQCYQQNDSVYPGGTNLIQNGGFENTTCGFDSIYNYSWCPNSLQYSCNIANWICTGGGSRTYCYFWDSNTCYIDKGLRSAYFGNWYANACSSDSTNVPNNDTTCLNSSECIVMSVPIGYPNSGIGYGDAIGVSLSQTITGLIIGNTYILEFWAGGENDDGLLTRKGLFAVDVGFGNTFLRDKPTPPHIGIGTRFLIIFNATSSSHTIKFTNWGHICSHCSELVLDDVKLYQMNSTTSLCPPGSGISTLQEETNITIFPNPFTSQTTITFSEEQRNTTIYIRDVLGREVNSQQVSGNSALLDMSSKSKGIYFVQITDEKGNTINKKIVVQ